MANSKKTRHFPLLIAIWFELRKCVDHYRHYFIRQGKNWGKINTFSSKTSP